MKVPTNVTLTTNAPAAAVPEFVTVKLLSVSSEMRRSGSGRAIVQSYVAGALALPAASSAVTANVCEPGASPE